MGAVVEDDSAVRTDDVHEAGRLPASLVAKPAAKRRTDPFAPTCGVEDPRAQLERRLVAHVSAVAAGELGDPVAVLVLVIADDCALH